MHSWVHDLMRSSHIPHTDTVVLQVVACMPRIKVSGVVTGVNGQHGCRDLN